MLCLYSEFVAKNRNSAQCVLDEPVKPFAGTQVQTISLLTPHATHSNWTEIFPGTETSFHGKYVPRNPLTSAEEVVLPTFRCPPTQNQQHGYSSPGLATQIHGKDARYFK